MENFENESFGLYVFASSGIEEPIEFEVDIGKHTYYPNSKGLETIECAIIDGDRELINTTELTVNVGNLNVNQNLPHSIQSFKKMKITSLIMI